MRARAWCVLLASLAGIGAGSERSVQERLGHPASARLLVIHADDLGMSRSVDRATFEALEKGLITSASVMVPCPWFPEVARFAREHPAADLGIHLTLNSEWTTYRWGPVSSRDAVTSLVDSDGYFPLEETAVVASARPAEVEAEIRAQIARARAAGLRLSHLDSHMATLFRSAALFEVYRRVGAESQLPILLERLGERGGESAASWFEAARGEALLDRVVSISPGVEPDHWLEAYQRLLHPLPPGVYQLIVHLGYDDEEMRGATVSHPDWGAAWRQSDLELVRSAAFRRFLDDERFRLVSWTDLGRAARR